MKKILISKFALLILLLMPLNCGFKVLKKSENYNYSIKDIIVNGDKRIGFKIKNNLLNNSRENSQNELIVNVNVKRNKNIKEKNIRNEITKYEINLNVQVSYYLMNNIDKAKKLNFSINGDYNVDQFHTKTITNEKTLIDNLIENITEKISNEIGAKINDF